MSKGSGATRTSSASSPKGLTPAEISKASSLYAIRRDISSVRASLEGASTSELYKNERLVSLLDGENRSMWNSLKNFTSKGWKEGLGSIYKEIDSPRINSINVSVESGGIKDGNYYKVSIGGYGLGNGKEDEYLNAVRELERKASATRFSDANKAVSYIEREARKINKKYR